MIKKTNHTKEFKSCFVKDKHLSVNNKCNFCAKTLLDIREMSEEEIVSKVSRYKNGTCVIANPSQVEDKRSLFAQIKETISRASKLYSGYRFVGYASLFVVLTVFSSCRGRRNNPGPGGFFKIEVFN